MHPYAHTTNLKTRWPKSRKTQKLNLNQQPSFTRNNCPNKCDLCRWKIAVACRMQSFLAFSRHSSLLRMMSVGGEDSGVMEFYLYLGLCEKNLALLFRDSNRIPSPVGLHVIRVIATSFAYYVDRRCNVLVRTHKSYGRRQEYHQEKKSRQQDFRTVDELGCFCCGVNQLLM